LSKAETIFFQVLSDIKGYLDNLTLVGGWVPYVYAKYLWKNVAKMPLTTSDIDLGIGKLTNKLPSKTIYEKLFLKYGEHHISMDRIFPVVFHLENVEIHFISTEGMPKNILEKFVGRQVEVSKVEHFEVLLNNRITVNIVDGKSNKYKLYVPAPPPYIYHKGLTFVNRDYNDAKAKDLHYIYYILRFCPNSDEILSELKKFKRDKDFAKFMININRYFERISSQGCLMVEKENGPDEYIDDLRQDIFDRFKRLQELLKK
jgi:hypothetical protein